MIAIGSDHAGFALKQEIMQLLTTMGLEYKDYGTYSLDSCDYPVYGKAVGEAVASGECERGILVCGTGVGIGQAAAKVPGTFVCTCSDVYTARLSRMHNDSNILSIGARVIGGGLAEEIVRTWLDTPFCQQERHARRIAMVTGKEVR